MGNLTIFFAFIVGYGAVFGCRFFSIATQLSIMIENSDRDGASGLQFSIKPEEKATFLRTLSNIEKECERLGLTISSKAARNAISRLEEATYFGSLSSAVDQFRNIMEWEMDSFLFFHVPPKQAEFYNQQELFGSVVGAKFPATQYDMVEAGNCYSLGRSTACVFHLMRIMEVGVQEFGNRLGVNLVADKNWQNILDESNKAIRALPARASTTVEMNQVSAKSSCGKAGVAQ